MDIKQTLLHPATLGHIALIFFICVNLLQAICFAFSEKDFAKTVNSFKLSKISFGLVSFAYLLLTYFYIASDFSVKNVFENSHTAKPFFYQIAGVWGNHEGSMLLFLLILSCFGFVFSLKDESPFRKNILDFQAVICLLLGLYIYFTSNPFDLSPTLHGRFPIQGMGLNPLLQDFGLAIHPPTLYIGYVGFSLAFSASILVLKNSKPNVDNSYLFEQLVVNIKPLVLFSWAFLTLGVALGSWWAYRELGWGGFWFWDPVENSSLMPWLSATALLHCILVLEKRRALQNWTIFFSLLTFILSLIGFFLVRSGILSSVHSFASDPTRGIFMLIIVSIISIYGFGLFAFKSHEQGKQGFYKLLSREGLIVISNIFILSLIATILLGVFYPLILDLTAGRKISVGAPYFKLTFIPISVMVLLLTVFGPYTKWQQDKITNPLKELTPTLLISFVITVIIGAVFHGNKLGIIDYTALIAGFWLAGSMISRLISKIKKSGGLSATFLSMFFAHTGIAVLAVAVSLLTSLNDEKDFIIDIGQSVDFHGYEIKFNDIAMVRGPNYIASQGQFTLKRKYGSEELLPEFRVYIPSMQKTTEAAISYGFISDVYLVIGQPENAGEQTQYAIKVYLKPFMNLMWFGVLMIFIGGLTGAFMKDKKKAKK